MDELTQQTERFRELLSMVSEEVTDLKSQIRDLRKENAKLTQKIEDIQGKQTDIFSAISESERLALRQHVIGLITKIDQHLNEQA